MDNGKQLEPKWLRIVLSFVVCHLARARFWTEGPQLDTRGPQLDTGGPQLDTGPAI